MSDHYHYEYAEARHDHRGEYASDGHDHWLDYAEKHHRHCDDESTARGLREDLGQAEERIRELEDGLRDALERIRALEDRQPDYADPEAADDESWRTTLADYHVASGGAEYAVEGQDAGLAPCGCPEKDGMIRHRRSSCTDPIAARLDWYADDGGRP